jgi:threonylcarbamoyladenosine tRNA methylthiotransferase MtaB
VSEVEVVSFGCRLNLAESDAILRIAQASGAGPLTVINGCAVTGEAMRQARQSARRARRARPDARVVVAGCAAKIDPEAFLAMEEVDAVVGNDEKLLASTWARFAQGGEPPRRLIAEGLQAGRRVQDPIAVAETRTRAFLQIQNGCDHRCTFCIIPYARGPSRSIPPERLIARARELVDEGVAEIVLTGVDITAYGLDLGGEMRLGALVRKLLREAPALSRLRLSSIDSIEADDDLTAAIAEEPRLMPHFHLSLQSGDDLILKRMKRRHRRADATAFCEAARRERPGVAFSADLIAGFPTETDAMFQNSIDLIADCGLARAHVFPYSPRPGTPAARMPLVDPMLARDRAARLREASDSAWSGHLKEKVGRSMRVLTERGGVARAEDFTPLRVGSVEPGLILDAVATASDGRDLEGRIVLA